MITLGITFTCDDKDDGGDEDGGRGDGDDKDDGGDEDGGWGDSDEKIVTFANLDICSFSRKLFYDFRNHFLSMYLQTHKPLNYLTLISHWFKFNSKYFR